MFNYYAFGLNISSEIELPGVFKNINNEPDVKIIQGKVQSEVFGSKYIVEYDDIYLRWDDIGKVKLSNGNQITIDIINKNLIIPFLLGPIMALLLHQRGFLVLHGSSIKINGKAIAFIGYRGMGKSTTAINLYKKGYPLITDDILAINFDNDNIPYIYPGYPHVRLSEDSYNHIKDDTDILTLIRTIIGKVFCDASREFSPEKLMLKRVYLIERGDRTRIFTLDSQKNLMNLICHSVYNLIFPSNKNQANNLNQCSNLIKNVQIRRLEVIHSFNNISGLIELIEDDLTK